jgi:hypothetical protein
MKTPHIPLRSPDLTLPSNTFRAYAPKKGYSRFVSRGRRAACDTDIKVKRVKKTFVPQKVESKEFKGRTLKDGSFMIQRREGGKFSTPLTFDASLMAKLV